MPRICSNELNMMFFSQIRQENLSPNTKGGTSSNNGPVASLFCLFDQQVYLMDHGVIQNIISLRNDGPSPNPEV